MFKSIAIGILVLILAFGFFFAVDQVGNAWGLWNTNFWGTKQANAEREVFVNTNAYVQGKTVYLTRLRLAYKTSDSEAQKSALKDTILTEASTVDNEKLPVDLQVFIHSLKGE